MGLVVAAFLWDQIPGFIRIDEAAVPILNPELWPWAMLGLVALVALEIGFAIVLFSRKGWSAALAIINAVLAAVFLSWAITLLVRGDLFSADFIDLWVANGVNADTLYTLAVIFGFSVAIICTWDIIDGWVKTYRTGVEKRTQSTAGISA